MDNAVIQIEVLIKIYLEKLDFLNQRHSDCDDHGLRCHIDGEIFATKEMIIHLRSLLKTAKEG